MELLPDYRLNTGDGILQIGSNLRSERCVSTSQLFAQVDSRDRLTAVAAASPILRSFPEKETQHL